MRLDPPEVVPMVFEISLARDIGVSVEEDTINNILMGAIANKAFAMDMVLLGPIRFERVKSGCYTILRATVPSVCGAEWWEWDNQLPVPRMPFW